MVESCFAALDRVVVLREGAGVSGSLAFVVAAALESLGKPGTRSMTEPPFTGEDAVAFVVEAPVPGSLSVILDVPADDEYSGSECGAGRSDMSWWK